MTRKILAWCVHLYTGMGLVCAAAIALCIFRGTPEDIRQAFLWMLLATLIDATDGTLARAADVKHVLPGFDGRRLDDLIDFQTYTTLPLLLIWRTAVLPPGYEAWLLLALLASGYGFSQAEAKTEDGFFLGFPSYWNIVAFYLYMLGLPPFLALGIVVVCAVLTFVPTKYLYPSISGPLSKVTIGLGAVWTVIVLIILSGKAPNSGELVWISLFYPMYYMGASWLISLRGARTG